MVIAGRSQPAFCALSVSIETGVLKFGEKSGGRSSGLTGPAGGALDCALPLRTIETGLRIGVGTGFAFAGFLFFASKLAAEGVGGLSLPIVVALFGRSAEGEDTKFRVCCFLACSNLRENAMVMPGEAAFRPLNVKDALSYLDRVKVTFADQAEGELEAPSRSLRPAP